MNRAKELLIALQALQVNVARFDDLVTAVNAKRVANQVATTAGHRQTAKVTWAKPRGTLAAIAERTMRDRTTLAATLKARTVPTYPARKPLKVMRLADIANATTGGK